jgi:T-complex protein 1 subunit gamma
MLSVAEPFINKQMHPSKIIAGYTKAMEDAKEHLDSIAYNLGDAKDVYKLVESSIGTKFISRWIPNLCQIAVDAVRLITIPRGDQKEIDIKRYIRIERVSIFCFFSYFLNFFICRN